MEAFWASASQPPLESSSPFWTEDPIMAKFSIHFGKVIKVLKATATILSISDMALIDAQI